MRVSAGENFCLLDWNFEDSGGQTPRAAVNPAAAKTLNRSGMPKNAGGTIAVPTAPVIIRVSAASAHHPRDGNPY